MKVIGVIPARYASTRLAEKVLKRLNGKPMIQHVWSRTKRAKRLARVLIACDDPRVEACAREFGAETVMTRVDHPSGSCRIAEVASKYPADVFINIQGDEPLIHPDNIDKIVEIFETEPSVRVATLAVRKKDRQEYENPNAVKVVTASNGDALYFSRAPIPHFREGGDRPFGYWKHLGIYGYRKEILELLPQWQTSLLEDTEKLEQLRLLERGIPIRVAETVHDSFGVDTAEDLRKAESELKATTETDLLQP